MQIFINNTSANLKLPIVNWDKTSILKWNNLAKKLDPKSTALSISAIGCETLRE